MAMEIKILASDRYTHLAVLDQFIGIKSLLDYWIANDNSDINKS
jgi:hypothetical protein